MLEEVKQDAPSTVPDSIASRLLKIVPTLRGHDLRLAFVRQLVSTSTPDQLRRAFDEIWQASDEGQQGARDVMLAIVGLMAEPEMRQLLASLGSGFLVQSKPALASRKPTDLRACDEERKVPDYGAGRPLTLGERKSLARRPDRQLMQRLLLDPNPSVIRNLLANSRVTEDDVLTLAARRPISEQLIEELLRHPKWSTRRRIRMAIVLNPSCPTSIGFALSISLMRSELRVLAQSTEVSQDLRLFASSRLQFLGRHRKPVD